MPNIASSGSSSSKEFWSEFRNVKKSSSIKRTAGSVVGHVPFNLAPIVSAFLRRDVSKGLVEVTGSKINRGAGYGLEIPCTYHFYGAKSFTDKLNELVEALRKDGRI